jgi:AraC-like DNA-binding protein
MHGHVQSDQRNRALLVLLFRANRLLNGLGFPDGSADVVAEGRWQALPTVTGFAAKRAIVALRKRNVAVAPLLRRAGLSKRDFFNTQHRVSAAAQGNFLEYAAEALNDSAFGLHVAEQTNPREAGLLFYVASAAKNLGEALVLFERYFRIVNEAVRLKLKKAPKSVVVEVDFVGLSRHCIRQNAEFGIAVIFKALREIAARNFRPTRVTFAGGPLPTGRPRSDLREFERFYGCRIEFGASSDQLAFSNETLAVPLVTEDRYLLKTLRPICDAAARKRGTQKGTLRAAVENEVQKLLPQGKVRKETIAKSLGLGVRTFMRRLTYEGTTYAEIVDQLRRSLALQYIKEPGISISQIAWLLGYEKQTSFNHAFRRWTGRSPSTVRAVDPVARRPAQVQRRRSPAAS